MTRRERTAAVAKALLRVAVAVSAIPSCLFVLSFLHATLFRDLSASGLRLVPDVAVILGVPGGLLWLVRRSRSEPHNHALTWLSIAVVLMPVAAISIRREVHVSADRRVYRKMLEDPVLGVRPAGARALGFSRIGPCKGDSGTGPLVERNYDWVGDVSELFAFYADRLRGLGWRDESSEDLGVYKRLSATRRISGHEVGLEVRAPGLGGAYSLSLRARPQQDCLLPLS